MSDAKHRSFFYIEKGVLFSTPFSFFFKLQGTPFLHLNSLSIKIKIIPNLIDSIGFT